MYRMWALFVYRLYVWWVCQEYLECEGHVAYTFDEFAMIKQNIAYIIDEFSFTTVVSEVGGSAP